MTRQEGLVYELRFVLADSVDADALDAWLIDVMRRARLEDGVGDVKSLESLLASDSAASRTVQIEVVNKRALDELRDTFLAGLETSAAETFGDRLSVSSRMLRPDDVVVAADNALCLNCGAQLRGQYCGQCGQRSRTRLISIWQLLREAFGDLLELDSRLWRTLIPLLVRPGRLTRDYLEGRRARYMPPFRTYLVLSLVFFVVAFFDPREDLSLFFEADPLPTAAEQAELDRQAASAAAEREQKRTDALQKLKELKPGQDVPDGVIDDITDDNDGFTVQFNGKEISSSSDEDSDFFGNCDEATLSDEDDAPEWVKKRFTDERIKQICERNNARGIDNLGDAIIDNVPVALIVLLPLMAFALKLLYPLSRRYFVEHLLFFIHFHAFFFLMLTLQLLFASFIGLFAAEEGAIDAIKSLLIVVTSFYIPIYLYKAMRHVYAQSHLVTVPKYLLLISAYLTGATATMLGVLLLAIMSA